MHHMQQVRKLMTLDEFTIQELRNFPRATGELSGLFMPNLSSLGYCKTLSISSINSLQIVN
jgi:hypothetical protein